MSLRWHRVGTMKRILILFNHFQIQDGVARSAIGIANALSKKPDVEVTICPLFRYDTTMLDRLNARVIVKPIFRHYFRGMAKLVAKLPMKWLYKWIIGNDYDVQVGLCMSLPIKIVAAFPKKKNNNQKSNRVGSKSHIITRFAWMHGYDNGLTLKAEYERIGKVVCVSKFNADRLKKEAENAFNVEYAYNLVDDEEIRKKGLETIPVQRPDCIQFVTVGRMSPEKGYVRLLEICQRLKIAGYHFKIWLIGDGPQKEELEVKAKELDVEGIVEFLGQKSNPHAYTAKADVFICSSFDEGYSTACTEAIILGVPVITTDVSGGQEIIDEAECGLIVPKDSDDALYQAMRKVLENEEIVANWKKTLSVTRERFSYKNRIEKLYKIFEMD